jgi:hypothetical protein
MAAALNSLHKPNILAVLAVAKHYILETVNFTVTIQHSYFYTSFW